MSKYNITLYFRNALLHFSSLIESGDIVRIMSTVRNECDTTKWKHCHTEEVYYY